MSENYTIVHFDKQSPLSCIMRRIGTLTVHTHDMFELDMVLSGRCSMRVGDQSYILQADDVISVDAHTPHSLHGLDCTMIVIQFEQSFFERTLPVPRHPDFLCNSAIQGNSAAYDSLRRLIARLVKNNADRSIGYELRNWAFIYQIMDVMYQHFRVEDSEVRNRRAHRYTRRMAQLSEIISQHYQDNLTLSELADKVHLSAPYLSKFFEKQFGVTYLNYLTRIRLEHAVNELTKTNDTIEVISAGSGFPNSHAFVQAFRKEYGMLPSVYRRQMRQDAEEPQAQMLLPEQHDYMASLRKYLAAPETAAPRISSVSCRIQLDAAVSHGTLHHNWRCMAAAVTASGLLSRDLQDLLTRVQKEIGFTYLKFNGILSEDMHVYSEDQEGNPVYSFAYVDKVLDFLQSVQLRPLVQLSFMPLQLARDSKRLFGYLVSEPESLEKWSLLVQALIRHLLRRYGREEVHSWLFSVWEQPDTPASMYGFSSDDNFYYFYEATFRAVKETDPLLCVGSPATYYILRPGYRNWYLPFWDWCRAHDCEPDFLSLHYYDTAFTEESRGSETFGFPSLTYDNKDQENGHFPTAVSLREEADGFDSFVNQVRQERTQYLHSESPIYLTEWNSSPSQQDLLNDTCFKSCYIMKCILENYDKLDSYAFWSLTDWMGEAPQPPQLFHGGLGLFTADGIPKASYYAFTLLRKLGDVFLGKGPGWFATRRGEELVIILYHYRHYSHLYAKGERFDMTFTDRYTPFTPEQALDVHLHLSNMEDGEYLVRETLLNSSSGSPFDLWVSMGALETDDRTELENLSSRSIPAIQKYQIPTESGILRLDAMLDLLEVRLLEIKRVM